MPKALFNHRTPVGLLSCVIFFFQADRQLTPGCHKVHVTRDALQSLFIRSSKVESCSSKLSKGVFGSYIYFVLCYILLCKRLFYYYILLPSKYVSWCLLTLHFWCYYCTPSTHYLCQDDIPNIHSSIMNICEHEQLLPLAVLCLFTHSSCEVLVWESVLWVLICKLTDLI